MKKKILIASGAVVLIAVIVFASIRGGGSKGEKVYVEQVKPRTIQAIVTATGEVDPKVKVNISAHIVGKIERLYFNEGDMVRKGQKLVDQLLPLAHHVAFVEVEALDLADDVRADVDLDLRVDLARRGDDGLDGARFDLLDVDLLALR